LVGGSLALTRLTTLPSEYAVQLSQNTNLLESRLLDDEVFRLATTMGVGCGVAFGALAAVVALTSRVKYRRPSADGSADTGTGVLWLGFVATEALDAEVLDC
jgi:hypothetical protein